MLRFERRLPGLHGIRPANSLALMPPGETVVIGPDSAKAPLYLVTDSEYDDHVFLVCVRAGEVFEHGVWHKHAVGELVHWHFSTSCKRKEPEHGGSN